MWLEGEGQDHNPSMPFRGTEPEMSSIKIIIKIQVLGIRVEISVDLRKGPFQKFRKGRLIPTVSVS